jgi:UDP-N-acetylmuramate-alanine ligase
MAFLIFAEAETTMVALETGLGGRLDATNVVRPEIAVITPIDFDHEVFLGRSLETIAGEKAGILKPGAPAVFARQRPEVEAVLERRAAELGVRVERSADWSVCDLDLSARGSGFLLRTPDHRALGIRCPLAGEHQVVEYGPVPFAKKNLQLWLPKSAEIYLDFRRHRYYRRHSFDHYMLFSVNSEEKVKEPKASVDTKPLPN